MDFKEKIKAQEQELGTSQVNLLIQKKNCEEAKKQYYAEKGKMDLLKQLAVEQEAEKAEQARIEAEKKKQSGKAGEKK